MTRIQRLPVDLGFEGGLERFIRFDCAEEVCLENEEAGWVTIGCNPFYASVERISNVNLTYPPLSS